MTPVRLAAARALVALERGRTTLAAEAAREQPDLADPRDRALFLEIAAGVLRWRAELDACLAARSARPIGELSPEVRAVLRVGAYQLLHLARVPAHAIVNEAVETVRALRQPRAAGFVNAVLRGLTRGADVRRTLPRRPKDDASDRTQALDYLSVALSHPRWLVARWLDRVGFDNTERWCQFNNAAPGLTARPLPSAAAEDWVTRLRTAGVEAAPARFVPGAVQLPPGALGRIAPDLRARLLVQDEGAQLVALAVGARPGDRILDVCAAPGGKTVMLAGAAGPSGLVVAGDHRPVRVELLRSMLARAGVRSPIVALDATSPLPVGPIFDRVLLDAPCSGLGTLRRDPDLKWSRKEEDLLPLAAAQLRMLTRAADVVRPGGVLVYATCSSEPEENDAVIERFLGAAPAFRLERITLEEAAPHAAALVDPQGFLRTLPFRDELDAFFAARLVRSGAA